MTNQTPKGLVLPPSKADRFELNTTSELPILPTDDAAVGELSPIAILCQDILTALNDVPDCPDHAKTMVGTRINGILRIFFETEGSMRSATEKISTLKSKLQRKTELLAVLRQELFDKSSEKGAGAAEEDDFEFELEDEEEEPKEASKGKRPRKVGDNIEIVRVDHYPDDMACCSCGHDLKSIKQEERVGSFRIIPEHVVLVKNVYHTCACNHGICKENKPVSAKSKNFIMSGRGMEAEFAAEAAIQKFFEHIPTFRMERRLQNSNVNLSRQAITKTIAHLSRYLEPVCDALHEHVKSAHAAQMDETPVRVLNPGKGKCDTGYFWVICRDERLWNPDAQPAVVYHYAPSRAGSVATELLSGSSIRFLQTDGYAGYNCLFKETDQNDKLVSARCLAHARRKFVETAKATKSPLATRVVKMFQKMYVVEKAASNLPPAEREAKRQEHSLPILNELYAELVKNSDNAHGALKAAINYTLNAFDGLKPFIFDGRLEIDNNPVERCIRGIALTKKNSLFAGTHEAANVWATYYSLIESARLNRVNPRSYLIWVVNEIERTRGELDYGLLMPWHCPTGHILD